ncbi:hypothetical protein Tco_1276175 [Tanacetum coccineum]
MAIANATKSLETSKSAEELRNQPKPANAEKEHVTIVEQAVEDPLAIDSKIELLGNVNLDELKEDLNREMKDDADITFMGSSSFDQEMEEANFDLESMLDDEIMSVSGNEAVLLCTCFSANFIDCLYLGTRITKPHCQFLFTEKANLDGELSMADEIEVSSVYASSLSPTTSPGEVQALIAKVVWEKKNIPQRTIPHVQALGALQRYKAIQIKKALRSDPLGHFPRRIYFLITHVHNLGLSLPDKFADKMDSSVPRMVANAIHERMPELISDTLKNILLQLLNDLVIKLMLKFDKRVKKTLKAEVPEVFLKHMYKEFNALNKLESQRFVTLILHSSVKAPRDILVVNAKHLQTKVDRTSNDLQELVELVTQLMHIIDSVAPPTNATIEGEKESQTQPDPTIEVLTSAQRE